MSGKVTEEEGLALLITATGSVSIQERQGEIYFLEEESGWVWKNMAFLHSVRRVCVYSRWSFFLLGEGFIFFSSSILV